MTLSYLYHYLVEAANYRRKKTLGGYVTLLHLPLNDFLSVFMVL